MTALQSEGITKLIPALLAAQAKFQPAVKNAINPAFKSKYVTLDAALDAVSEAFREQGVWLSQQTYLEDGALILATRLYHVSGEWLGSVYPINPVQATPQGMGSALTFARRYALMALCGIAPEDDDGNAATNGSPARQNGRAQASAPPAETRPDAGALRAKIADVGKSKHLTLKEIGDDFAAWSEGLAIGSADADLLQKYLDTQLDPAAVPA
jgi:hypothetical protein